MRHAISLLFVALLVTVARADDVTMKNGKVHKDLTLQKETKTAYIYLTHEGRKMTLPKASVKSIEKKPTVRGELMERIKKVGKRDADALCDLGKWAEEKGMKKDAKDLFKKALRADRNHAGAHEAIGDKMLNGKWVKAAVWKKAMAKEIAKEMKARGWKEHKGEWLSPVAYHREKNGYTRVQGQWVDPKMAKRIAKKKLTYAEGVWLEPKEKEKFDQGLRKYGKSWRDIETLDDVHSDFEDPWVIESEHFIVRSNCRHKDVLWTLKLAEEFYEPLVALFGEEHRNLYEKGGGKITIMMGRGLNTYRALGGRFAREDRVAVKSGGTGTFYSLSAEDGRGAAVTYMYGDKNYVEMWLANAVTNAFVANTTDWLKTDEKTLEALAGYVGGLNREGKYHPTKWFHWRWLNSPNERPVGAAHALYDRIGHRTEQTGPQAGFMMHFLRTKNAKAFEEFWRGFVGGKGGKYHDLLKACYGGKEPEKAALDAEFAEFLKTFNTGFQPASPRH